MGKQLIPKIPGSGRYVLIPGTADPFIPATGSTGKWVTLFVAQFVLLMGM